MKRHLQCAEQQDSSSNVTKYCTCHAKWLSWVMSITYETSFTMRGATGVIHQRHQVLCLPRKMTRIINPRDTWNVIYNARNNRHHPSTSPNAVPATKNDSHHWSSWHMKRHLQCTEQQASPSNLTKYCACHAKWLSWLMSVTHDTSFTMRGATDLILQHHQVLRLPRKSALQNLSEILRERLKRQFQCAADSTMIRPWSDHDPNMIRTWSDHELVISHPPVRRGYFSRFGDAFCIENYNISRSGYLSKFHRILRLPRKLTLQDHQILRLPCKMTLMIDVRHTWHVIYNARSNRSHPPTSPNAAPATQDDSHHLSSWHMKRYLQCAEEQASPANLTKYCACHAKWLSWLIFVTYETSFTMRGATGITLHPHQILRLPRKSALQNLSEILRERLKRQFQCAADSTMIRPWSEHDPNMIRPWTRHLAPARSPRLLFALRRRILYWKLQHFALRLSIQISPNTAPATKTDTPRSPNTAPATQNDAHDWCPSHMTRHLQCAEQQISSSNITKCCACHAKWLASSILVTYETLFTMRGGTGITRQPHQILRLPRKMTLMIDLRHIWNVIYNARSNRHHPPTSPNTAPATQKCTPKSKRNSPRTVEASIPMRGRFDHDPTMIRPWTRHLAPARSPRLLFALRRRILYWKLQHFALRLSIQISPNTVPATKSDTPTSPSAAPATQNYSHHLSSWHMQRCLQCAEEQASPANLTKYCACHAKWLSWLIFVTYGTSFTMRGATGITLQPRQILRLPRKSALQNLSEILRERLKRQFQCAADSTMIRPWSDHDPTMIRPWTRHLAPARSPRLLFALRRRILYWKLQHFALRLSIQISHTVPATKSDTPRSPNTAPATKSGTPRSPNAAPATKSDPELLLDCTLTWILPLLSCCLTEQLLLNCYLTELFLDWTVAWLNGYFTELLLYWAVILLSCYFTELLLYWTVTLLSCYFTELLLYWAVTLLNCYFTELLLYWAVTLLSCYSTELLLYWAVTLLSCYFTELLLYWTATLLSCYFTVLLLYWTLCIFKSP